MEKKLKIGFSQCTGGEWREQMNNEMASELCFYDNVELEIRNAEGMITKQIEDIRYFINQNVDLLIISPFEDKSLVNEFNNIDFKGIPILFVDRYISSNKHIAFVGASNLEVGKMAALYMLDRVDLSKPIRVLHIKGYGNSSASIDRLEGFINTLSPYKNIDIKILNGGKDIDGKTINETTKIINENREILNNIDVVYGFSDAITIAVSNEAEKMNLKNKILFIGVDGQIGYGRGIDAVKKNRIQASIVYPPGGEMIIETAMKIIKKIPVQKNISLPLTIIDETNIDSYYMQALQIQNYQNKIELLQNKIRTQISYMHKQKLFFNSVFISSILLVILALFLIYRNKSSRIKNMEIQHALEKKLFLQEQELVNIETNIAEEFSLNGSNTYDLENGHADQAVLLKKLEKFKIDVNELLEQNYTDYEFSVTTMVNNLSLSRMKLYRKFKQAFNDTPNDYIRKFRLNKAVKYIDNGEMNFSEITYRVGFSSPAYFTKCFKDMYNCTPSEYIKRFRK